MKHEPASECIVSHETMERLRVHARLLLKWNSTINLVSRADRAILWERHFEDCLQLLPLLPAGAKNGVDMGSGAGFPGMVLAIGSGMHFTLIEADHRKAAFLREVGAATDAPVTIQSMRVQDVFVDKVDVLTARALAPLSDLLDMGARFLKQNGVAIFQKGARAEAEIAEARVGWHMTIARQTSVMNAAGVVLKLTNLSRNAG